MTTKAVPASNIPEQKNFSPSEPDLRTALHRLSFHSQLFSTGCRPTGLKTNMWTTRKLSANLLPTSTDAQLLF